MNFKVIALTAFVNLFALVFAPMAQAVPTKTTGEKKPVRVEATDHAAKPSKRQTAANNWGFTPARDFTEESPRGKKVAQADTVSKDRKPAKVLSSGFKGFTPIREDLAANGSQTKTVETEKTKTKRTR